MLLIWELHDHGREPGELKRMILRSITNSQSLNGSEAQVGGLDFAKVRTNSN